MISSVAILKILFQVIAFVTCLVSQVSSFASCPSPRFDTFSDAIMGKWQYVYTSSSSPIVEEVQEVMRSCGGAVQGLREIPLPFPSKEATNTEESSAEEGRYHNRADDGFVYFDCGSYCAGPTDLAAGSCDSDICKAEFMASLTFASMPKCRLLIVSSEGKGDGGERNDMTVGLSRDPFRSATSSAEDEGNSEYERQSIVKESIDTKPQEEIKWEKETVVRMASPTQPFALQRAKWERFETAVIHLGDEDIAQPSPYDLRGWISVVSGKEGQNDDGITLSKCRATTSNVGGSVVQFCAVCQVTGQARALMRGYNSQGKLIGVVLQEGFVVV